MNNTLHEEKTITKSFDVKLFRKLFSFSKPYFHLLFLSFLLLFAVTGITLSRPYLIKVVIDDYILAPNTPLVATSSPLCSESVFFDGLYYTKSSDSSTTSIKEKHKFQLLQSDDGLYYLVHGTLLQTPAPNKKTLQTGLIKTDQGSGIVTKLSKEQWLQFRMQDKIDILYFVLIFIGIYILGFFLAYIQGLILNYAAQKQIYDMRRTLFSHILSQNLSFFDKNPVGRLTTRMTNDMKNISEMYTSVLIDALKDGLLVIGTVIAMLVINFKLALICLSASPLIYISARIFRSKARKAQRQLKVRLARINAFILESISGIQLIQIFNRQKKTSLEFQKINKSHFDASMKEVVIYGVFRPSINLIHALTLALLIFYGGSQALKGSLQLGVLFAFIRYVDQMFRPIFDLSEKFGILQSAMASAERISLLLDTDTALSQSTTPLPLEPFYGDIEFQNVWFAYEDKNWILKNLSFRISKGQTAAFVGATGSGKSTIISLLNRFYDVQKGAILIDGKDIRQLSIPQLRKKMGLVLQDVFLFSGTIEKNINLGDASIGEQKIKTATQAAQASAFINNLPEGYMHQVEERGSTFSSGERQLLSLARALAFDPQILIFDEATAHIDTQTESLIQQAIETSSKDKTTLIVAHRLSTVKNSDIIFTMKKGQICEQGTHQSLLSQNGLYASLYEREKEKNPPH